MKEFILKCKEAYYNGTPFITDEQYDAIIDIHGEDGVGFGGTVTHTFPMYSLKKYYKDEDTIPTFNSKLICTPKLDGAAISLLYKEGVLVQALTRGDGIKGEDITEKAINMKGVPNIINTKTLVQVTGEVVSPKEIPNSRNYASGALNLKNIEEFKERDVTFYAYELRGKDYNTYSMMLSDLQSLRFKTIKTPNLIDIYPTDGLVFRVDSEKEFQSLGYTSKHPRGAFALKERTEGVTTTLENVVWQVGKSGKVTPVALLKPVDIDGAVVSRATLNNVGFIKSLGLRLGDKVKVERSGGIIPRIISKA